MQLSKKNQGITVKILLDTLGVHSGLLLTLILSLPFLLPMPLPGLSTPFGVVLVLLGFSIALQRRPWLPKRLANMKVPEPLLKKILEKSEPLLKYLQKWMKPRLLRLTATKAGVSLHGILIMLAATLLTVPAPPGGNVGPALAIIFFSLAIIENDGVMSVLGFVILVATVVFFIEVIKLALSFIAFAHQATSLIC